MLSILTDSIYLLGYCFCSGVGIFGMSRCWVISDICILDTVMFNLANVKCNPNDPRSRFVRITENLLYIALQINLHTYFFIIPRVIPGA